MRTLASSLGCSQTVVGFSTGRRRIADYFHTTCASTRAIQSTQPAAGHGAQLRARSFNRLHRTPNLSTATALLAPACEQLACIFCTALRSNMHVDCMLVRMFLKLLAPSRYARSGQKLLRTLETCCVARMGKN